MGTLAREAFRRDVYKILSDCYYFPDKSLIENLNGLNALSPNQYLEIADNLQISESVESLQVDYARLFVGPFGLLAPPYGSIYLENARMLMGNSTLDVRNRYSEEGLIVNIKEVPDHIAIELEFMYFLIHKEIEAAFNNDSNAYNDFVRKQKDFMENYLSRWITGFTENTVKHAETCFYKRLACLTESFIKEDLEALSQATENKAESESQIPTC